MEMRRRRHPESLIRRVDLREPGDVPEPVPEIRPAGRRRRRGSGAPRLTGTACSSIRPDGPARSSPTAPTSIPATAGRRSRRTSAATPRRSRRSLSPDAAVRPRACASRRARRASCSPGGALERLPRLARRRGPLRRADQRLPLRPVPRHAGQGGGLRARLADAARVEYTLDLDPHPAAPAARPGMDGGVSTAPLTYKAWMRGGRRRRAGDDDHATSRASRPRCVQARRRARRASSISTSSPSRTACSRPAPKRSRFFEQSLLPARRRRSCATRSASAPARRRSGAARARAGLLRLLPLRRRVRGSRAPRCSGSRQAGHQDRPRATELRDRRRAAADADGAPQVVRSAAAVRRLDLPASGHRARRRAPASLSRSGRRARRSRGGGRSRVAHPLPRAALRRGLRRPRLDPGLRQRACSTLRAARAVHDPPRNRDLHLGRAARWPQDRPGRVDPPRVPTGCCRRRRRRDRRRVADAMHKTVVLCVVGLTPKLLGAGDAEAGVVGDAGRRWRGSSRPFRRSPAPRSPTTSPASTPTPTASSATGGTRARTARSGSGSSRTAWCTRRRSGTRRAPPTRRSPARTCSGGSTCTRRRTSRVDAAADVPGRRPQDPGRLHRAGRAARRAAGGARHVPAVRVLGPARVDQLDALDRRGGEAGRAEAQPDADARLPAAPRLRPAAGRARHAARSPAISRDADDVDGRSDHVLRRARRTGASCSRSTASCTVSRPVHINRVLRAAAA